MFVTNREHVQLLGDSLHAVHQQRAAHEDLVVEAVQRRHRLRLHRVVHLRVTFSIFAHAVDLRVDLPVADESRQLAVDERRGHAEALRHRLQRAPTHHAPRPPSPFVAVQELLVRLESQVADDEGRVLPQVRIALQHALQLQ